MVSRELTKKFEEHVGNNINEVIDFFKNKDIIGEITIVVKGIKKRDLNTDILIIKKDLNDLTNAGLSLSEASKYLAKRNGLKKSEVYNLI
jgi:16S rRNA (cytidine1402-2'-O)-methyltransferase